MTNKGTIQQILGSLMKHPQFLSEIDKYSLSISDFSTKFEKYVFNAINGLWHSGAQKITALDIESYLEANNAAKKMFEQQNGLEYLQDIEEFSNVENFPYYYTKLKKLNLLRDLKKQNFPVSEFYQEDLTAADAMEINQRFEELTVSDIITAVKKKLLVLESDYAGTEEVQEWDISGDIDDIVLRFKSLVTNPEQEAARTRKDQSFLVSAKEIIEKNWDLRFKTHKENSGEQIDFEHPSVSIARFKELEEEILKKMDELEEMFDE